MINKIIMWIFLLNRGKFYAFRYNPCIHESGPITVSLHCSKKGAEKALNKHKEKEYKEWQEYNKACTENDAAFFAKYPNTFGEYEYWDIQIVDVLP
jgi:hypothetical protein